MTVPQPRSDRSITATRLTFFYAGLALACWAPLVPFAKEKLGIDEAILGMLLLCMGLGSICAMPVAGSLAGKLGCRVVISSATAVLCMVIPLLALADAIWVLALSLGVFGAAVGSIDVTMNIQATMLEKETGRNIMSGFHGLFTLGSIMGAGGMSAVLSIGLPPLAGTVIVSLTVVGLFSYAASGLLAHSDQNGAGPWFVLPKGKIILIGTMCFIMFLAEGIVLDWGSLLLIEIHAFSMSHAGVGYTAFAIAMTLGRLTGDAVVQRLGAIPTLVGGSVVTMAGFFLAVLAPSAGWALVGLAAVGLGAANTVPILFSAAGRQGEMPAGPALSAAATLGYAGILVGPALIGWLAGSFGFSAAILTAGSLVILVTILGPLAITKMSTRHG